MVALIALCRSPAARADLLSRAGVSRARFEEALQTASAAGGAQLCEVAGYIVRMDSWKKAGQLARAALDAELSGITREALRRSLARQGLGFPPGLFAALLAELGVRMEGEVAHGRPPAPEPQALAPLEADVLAQLGRAGLTPPTAAELALRARATGPAVAAALQRLVKLGLAVRATDDLCFERRAVDGLWTKLRAHLQSHGSITVAELKELTGVSRKFAIPLSEHFDRERLTLRVGDRRHLREARR